MSQEAREAVKGWMASLGIRDPSNLGVADYAKLRGLLSSNERPGFGIFFSLLMFERQQAVAMLTNADLGNATGAVQAAKLQGIIQCVDNMRELILNIADPIGDGSDSDQAEQGVNYNG